MNDNIEATSAHHAHCLRLLNDLHDLFSWASAHGLTVASDDPDIRHALDFDFWRGQTAEILLVGSLKKNAMAK
jgi:hypothetical protein